MSPENTNNGRAGTDNERNGPAVNPGQGSAVDYEKIADRVYRMMKADLVKERERGNRPGGR